MENKSQPLIRHIKQHQNMGEFIDATTIYDDGHNIVSFGIDTQECIYKFRYQTSNENLQDIFELLSYLVKDKTVDEAYTLSKKSIISLLENENECVDLIKQHSLLLEKALSFFRKAFVSYWGYLNPLQVVDLICRCNALGKQDVYEAYTKHGEAKKVFQSLNISGVCGACKGDVNKILEKFELEEESLFGQKKEQWELKVKELLEDYYLVCPPEFSQLKFEFISITPRALKLKCIRTGTKPTRGEIQDSLNNYLKGEFETEIPVSVII